MDSSVTFGVGCCAVSLRFNGSVAEEGRRRCRESRGLCQARLQSPGKVKDDRVELRWGNAKEEEGWSEVEGSSRVKRLEVAE